MSRPRSRDKPADSTVDGRGRESPGPVCYYAGMNPTPFELALERVRPVLAANRFRLDAIEQAGESSGVSTAEYFQGDLRLRLVWEGAERVLWIEAARQAGAQVISRWTDIEWTLAGERLPPDPDVSEGRLDRLVSAVERFLAERR
jgi:hypothetical protein